MNDSLLYVHGLKKQFGDRTILAIEELALATGQSYALTGSNGAGKSTLLKVLAGIEPASCAQLRLDGREATLRPYPAWLRQEVVYVHQHPYLFGSSVRDNIAYGLQCRKVARAERQRRVEEAITWAGLEGVLSVPPQKLSGGEKQKVALARAMVLSPRLLLLDEPTANLDAAARLETIELIRRFATGISSVLVACHDTELADLATMQVLHLSEGRISPATLAGPG